MNLEQLKLDPNQEDFEGMKFPRVWKSIPCLRAGNEGERSIVREILALLLGALGADAEPHLRVAQW